MKIINIPLALTVIDGLIGTLNMKSAIGIQVAELEMLKVLLGSTSKPESNKTTVKGEQPQVAVDVMTRTLTGELAGYTVSIDDDGNPNITGITHTEMYKPVQPALRAAPMGLFPTMESLQQVIDLANSQLPVQTPNVMLGLLMCYHNTLLNQVQCCKRQ